jgi:hypothetical protein
MKRKRLLWAVLAVFVVALLALWGAYRYMVRCEGQWHGEPLEDAMVPERDAITKDLIADVEFMSVTIGERNPDHYKELARCADWVREKWKSQGYAVGEQTFQIDGRDYANLEVEIPGGKAASQIVLVSAQYDTLPGSPGANNNASGMAVLLKLSELLKGCHPDRTLRLVAFTTEEDPYFGTEKMGSYHYAKRSRERGEDIVVMLSLDAMGYYVHTPHSQRLPFPFSLAYPDRGDFLAFIGDLGCRPYLVAVTRGFRKGSSFPIHAGAVPKSAEGAGWSDHWSFWHFGYHGMQVTDTGGFRSPWHTNAGDTVDKLDFGALTRITIGLRSGIEELTTVRGGA